MKKVLCLAAACVLSSVLANAQSWTELGAGTGALNANNTIYRVATDASGNVYASGDFSNASSLRYVAKWNGTTWTELGAGTMNSSFVIAAMTTDASGNVYASHSTPDFKFNVKKWNGSTWSQLGVFNANGNILDIVADASGNVYATGSFTNASNKAYVAKWDGSTWTEMGTGANGVDAALVWGLEMDNTGNLYAAPMSVNSSTGMITGTVKKWTGTAWTPVGTLNTSDIIFGLTTDATGNVYVAGDFKNTAGKRYVARWDGTSWSELGTGANALNADSMIVSLTADAGGNIYAGGNFANSAGDPYVAKWNGTNWSELGTGSNSLSPNGGIVSVALGASGHVYAGGNFTNATGMHYVAKYTPPPPPCISAPLSPLPGSSVCADTITFKWPAVSGATGYDVYRNNGTGTSMTLVSSSQPDTVYTTTLGAGSYTWTVLPRNNVGAAAGCDSFALTVVPDPVPVITVSGNVNLSTGSFATYQWYKDGVAIPGATSQTYTATANGSYTVEVTNAQGCKGTSAAQSVTSISVGEVATSGAGISVWPNPTSGLLNIDATVPVDVLVLSIEGKEVFRVRNAKQISTEGLSSGLYLVVISDHRSGQKLGTRQFRKQ